MAKRVRRNLSRRRSTKRSQRKSLRITKRRLSKRRLNKRRLSKRRLSKRRVRRGGKPEEGPEEGPKEDHLGQLPAEPIHHIADQLPLEDLQSLITAYHRDPGMAVFLQLNV